MGALHLMVRVLLWGQIVVGVIGILFYGGLWLIVTLLGGLGGAVAAEEKVGGWVAAIGGGLVGAGALGAIGIWGLIKYLLKKALMIGGCILFLAGFPVNIAMMVGGAVAYFIGWSWQRSASQTTTQAISKSKSD